MSKKKIKGNLTFSLLLIVFSMLLITLGIIVSISVFLLQSGEMEIESRRIHPIIIVLVLVVSSLTMTMIVSFFVSRHFLKPIRQISQATKKIANGDFEVTLSYDDSNEIGELVQNFNLMVSDLKNIEILKNDFIDNVSHEFKTPLASISGYSALLQDESLGPAERRIYTQNIMDSARKLNELLGSILRLSKLESGETNLERTVYEVDEQIRQSILQLEKQWSDKNIELDIELEKIKCLGYEQLNQHIWLNIIGNAIKFSAYEGRVEISLKKISDSDAEFKVKDYGIGIKPAVINKIFDKFYQGDSSHSKEGNGLGLALVKKLIDMNGFDISVQSRYGEGSEFTVTLPLIKS